MALLVIQPVFLQHHRQPQSEHFQTEYIPVAVCLHVGQIGVIEVFTVIARDDTGVPHIHAAGLRQGFQIADKIKRRVGIPFDV